MFEIPAQISSNPDTENVSLWSEINILDLDELTGTKNVHRGDTVFVHMARGPMNIAYPFAITSQQPNINTKTSFSMRAKVLNREDQTVAVYYNFENFLPSAALKLALETDHSHDISALLSVSPNAAARLVAINIDGESFPYRVMEKPELSGFIHKGASIIPMR